MRNAMNINAPAECMSGRLIELIEGSAQFASFFLAGNDAGKTAAANDNEYDDEDGEQPEDN